MNNQSRYLMLLGESDVGKTHYGAQLLRRLNLKDGALKMSGAPSSIEPFEAALQKLSLGLAAEHTPRSYYADSIWPVEDDDGNEADLVWPDYGGEQIEIFVDSKKLPASWHERIINSAGWLVMVRPTRTFLNDDALTRSNAVPSGDDTSAITLTGQARVIELLQMLLFVWSASVKHVEPPPPLALLLSCYDEISTSLSPVDYLGEHLPLIHQFLRTNWESEQQSVFGLSALGQALSAHTPDSTYQQAGPESYGYVLYPKGERTPDLTVPVRLFMSGGKEE